MRKSLTPEMKKDIVSYNLQKVSGVIRNQYSKENNSFSIIIEKLTTDQFNLEFQKTLSKSIQEYFQHNNLNLDDYNRSFIYSVEENSKTGVISLKI